MILAVLVAGCVSPQSAIDPSTVRDLDDRPVDPFQSTRAKAVVLIFISNDCPISNRYAPEIRRLSASFLPRGVAFWLVHANPDESIAAIRQHARDYQYACPILRDPRHLLVQRARVQVTPETGVFTRGGQLVYHGRIDDRFVEFGRERPNPTRHDLEEVLQAILRGAPVPVNATRAIGCAIAELP